MTVQCVHLYIHAFIVCISWNPFVLVCVIYGGLFVYFTPTGYVGNFENINNAVCIDVVSGFSHAK